MDYSPPDSSVHGVLQAKILEWVAISFSGGSSRTRIESISPALQVDSLPTEPHGKPIDTRSMAHTINGQRSKKTEMTF